MRSSYYPPKRHQNSLAYSSAFCNYFSVVFTSFVIFKRIQRAYSVIFLPSCVCFCNNMQQSRKVAKKGLSHYHFRNDSATAPSIYRRFPLFFLSRISVFSLFVCPGQTFCILIRVLQLLPHCFLLYGSPTLSRAHSTAGKYLYFVPVPYPD